MKKCLTIFVLLVLSLLLNSCKMDLENSLDKLSSKGYTMEGEMEITLSSRYINTQSIVVEMMVESTPKEAYTEIIMNNSIERSYSKINSENEVECYVYNGSEWKKETMSMEEYEDENDFSFIDIELIDAFVLEDNVWVGDTEILTAELEDYFEEMFGDVLGYNSIYSFNISKYNIEMNGMNISKMDISMSFLILIEGIYITVEIDMPMEFTKVGKTKVTVPKGIK